MRPEEKDKILLLAKQFLKGNELEEFARKLDEMEEERVMSIPELVDKISELIAELVARKSPPEIRGLVRAVTHASVYYLIGPKLTELFVSRQVEVRPWNSTM